MGKHRWSGWPGAWCMDCGQPDKLEIAIGRGLYDPFMDTWEDGVNPADYDNGECQHSGEKLADPYERARLLEEEKKMENAERKNEEEMYKEYTKQETGHTWD